MMQVKKSGHKGGYQRDLLIKNPMENLVIPSPLSYFPLSEN